MSEAVKGLEPHAVWDLFAQISRFPHGSKNEGPLASHISELAKKSGCTVKQDYAGNLCICVPATKGYEKSQTLVLQAHLDMVCEKNDSRIFNFNKDSIILIRSGDWISADGTTLGADNGIGVAAALEAAFSRDIIHGPLEILLTVDEETGLTGAVTLSDTMITGRILINLDSENSKKVCVGCAGGGGVTTSLQVDFQHAPDCMVGMALRLFGLQGGHSGLNIHENRGNAVKLVTRILSALKKYNICLADLQSGDKHNAIPREASVKICLPAEIKDHVVQTVNAEIMALKAEFFIEPQLSVVCDDIIKPARVLSDASFNTVLNMLLSFPHGVLAMSRVMPGLVETSNNLASAHLQDGTLVVHTTPRSSCEQSLHATVAQICAIADLAGATSVVEKPYPGWHPNLESKLLYLIDDVYKEVFGYIPVREATHAGLECGLIGEKFKGMDMISIGPDIINCHSPAEAVNIESVENLWKILVSVLEKIAKS